MKVVILCGGLGARLREETEFRPKPMVTIGSKPILWHIMKTYAHYGFTDFVLPLGYKGDLIREYFFRYELLNNDVTIELGAHSVIHNHKSHSENGWKITLVDTGEKTLKGGRIKRIESYIDGEIFLLTYGDGVADIDLPGLMEFHRNHGRIATLTGVHPAARFGELKVRGNEVISFREKPTDVGDTLINGGFYVLDRRIFDSLSMNEDCDFEYGLLEKLANDGQLMVYRHSGFWACMDTLRDRELLQRLWDEGNAAWKIWREG